MPSMGHLHRCANKQMVRCSSSVFRAKSQNNEKSNTELELFELVACQCKGINFEFVFLCCVMAPGPSKNIRHHTHLCSHQEYRWIDENDKLLLLTITDFLRTKQV